MLFAPDDARLSHLVRLPEGQDLGAAVDAAMRAIETHNVELKDVLPKNVLGNRPKPREGWRFTTSVGVSPLNPRG